MATATEQAVDGWFVLNAATGKWEQAFLDVVTADPITGATFYFDVTIPCDFGIAVPVAQEPCIISLHITIGTRV